MKQVLDTSVTSRSPLDENSFAPTDHFTTDESSVVWPTACHVVKKTDAMRAKKSPESQWCSFIVAHVPLKGCWTQFMTSMAIYPATLVPNPLLLLIG